MSDATRIVQAARGWIGTRFHHQGRLKRTAAHPGGVDCLGLLVGVARELDLRLPDGSPLVQFDRTDYTHTPDAAHLRTQLACALQEISIHEMRAGDVVLLDIDRSPQHLAIIGELNDGMSLIHAYAPARAVVEHVLDAWWRARISAVFRIRS